jgi:capsular polysaccharide biosynthesis protein
MSENHQQGKGIDFLPMLDLIKERFLALLAFAVAGALAAFIFSKVVTPLYESSVIMYPSNSNSREKQLEDFSFGHEIQAERLMQLLSSNTMLDSLEAKFHLAEHYQIDKTRPDWYDQLLTITRDRISFHKNKYVSVGISVVDADPEFCALVANDAARLVNVINADIVKNAARSSLEIIEKEYQRRLGRVHLMNDSIIGIENTTITETKSKLRDQVTGQQRRIQTLRDSLDNLRRIHNIYDFSYQINVLNEHLAEARANYLQESGILDVIEKNPNSPDSLIQIHRALRSGAKLRVDNFSTDLEKLSRINKRYLQLEGQLELETELNLSASEELQGYQTKIDPNLESRRINRLEDDYRWDQLQTQELNAKYQRALSNYLDPVPAAIVVSNGKASYKKIYPHTLVNLALGGFSAFFFGLLLFSFLDRRKGGVA